MFHPHLLPRFLGLLLLALLVPFSQAGPLFEKSHVQKREVLKTDSLAKPPKQQPIKSTRFLDAAPNSIGLLITTPGGEEEEVLHLWLPIGERVYTRHHPILPLHPLTVRITTLIAESPSQASPEYLAKIECRIIPGFGGPMQLVDRRKPLPTEFAARSFFKEDGSVQVGNLFGVDGWEVEGYECREAYPELWPA